MWEELGVAAFELEVGEEDAGKRLDVVLAARAPNLSRARAKAMIEQGLARLGGRLAKKGDTVALGDRISLERLPGPVDFYATPDPELALELLFETEDFVVVDKAVGVPSHPLNEGEVGTLAGALVARYPEMRDVGYSRREPGIVHRLDTGTSGVMLAARHAAAFEKLRQELRAGRIEKRYLARCLGIVSAPRIIDTPIANDPRDARKVRVCTNPREIRRLDAKPARTEVLRSLRAEHGSLVELRANHARRHQVRAHLASIGHPLLGDALYGGPALQGAAQHHLLHALSIRVEGREIIADTWNYSTNTPELEPTRSGSKRDA